MAHLQRRTIEKAVRRFHGCHFDAQAATTEHKVEGEPPEPKAPVEEIPYGMRISADCQRLEVDPDENQILMHMMELMVQDWPLRRIAADLNQRGYRTRAGGPWSAGAVFDMIPRLIDIGPRLFSTKEWGERRKSFAREF